LADYLALVRPYRDLAVCFYAAFPSFLLFRRHFPMFWASSYFLFIAAFFWPDFFCALSSRAALSWSPIYITQLSRFPTRPHLPRAYNYYVATSGPISQSDSLSNALRIIPLALVICQLVTLFLLWCAPFTGNYFFHFSGLQYSRSFLLLFFRFTRLGILTFLPSLGVPSSLAYHLLNLLTWPVRAYLWPPVFFLSFLIVCINASTAAFHHPPFYEFSCSYFFFLLGCSRLKFPVHTPWDYLLLPRC